MKSMEYVARTITDIDGGFKRNTKIKMNAEEKCVPVPKLTLICAASVTIRQDSLMDEMNVPDEGKSISMGHKPLSRCY
jgi:hypothetical protein